MELYYQYLPPGDITQPLVSPQRGVTIDKDTLDRLYKFHESHPGVDLSPIINERIHDLLDECERNEVE